jgi:hypothetical protein
MDEESIFQRVQEEEARQFWSDALRRVSDGTAPNLDAAVKQTLLEELEGLVEDGLLEKVGDGWRITQKGLAYGEAQNN